MSRAYYLQNDIYDKDGKLLLAAGLEITQSMLKKLTKMDVSIDVSNIREIDTQDENIRHIYAVKNSAKQIRGNLKIADDKILDVSSEIVIDIIFNSKDKPWWLYVNTLSNYVDWVYSHSINVAIISAMLAKALGLKKELKDIALGALLHDIGKLMIPKMILFNARELTTEEMFYMRQHCDLGISMLKGHPIGQASMDIIGQHHERLDGSGYPAGLKHAQIPLHSRIVMIADIIDAITSYRPYKPARSIESAVEELREAGNKYPQNILDVFCSLITI